jgi:hypothetical protein
MEQRLEIRRRKRPIPRNLIAQLAGQMGAQPFKHPVEIGLPVFSHVNLHSFTSEDHARAQIKSKAAIARENDRLGESAAKAKDRLLPTSARTVYRLKNEGA